jgi:hypothetical protein
MNEYPYQYNTIDNFPSDNSIEKQNLNNKFQQIQYEIKKLIKKDNPNFDNNEIENQLHKLFNLGSYKNSDIKNISDNCINIYKCAKNIYYKYKKYLKINNADNINDIEQDSIIENNNHFDDWDYMEEEKITLKSIYYFLLDKFDGVKLNKDLFKNKYSHISFWYKDRMFMIFRRNHKIVLIRSTGKTKVIKITSNNDIINKIESIVPKNENVIGYFVCDRYRQGLCEDYCKDFFKSSKPRLFKTYKEAYKKLNNSFFDDSDYGVVMLKNDGNVKIIR